MIDIHPPQHASMTRREFFTHLGIVILGILIAIGLEQSIEYLHHTHQRRQLLNDIHAELVSNRDKDRLTQEALASFRIYLVELNSVLRQKLAGKSAAPDPSLEDHRKIVAYASSMFAWQSAKESGSADLLPGEQIRTYDRYTMQLQKRNQAIDQLDKAMGEMQAFEERFRDARAFLFFNFGSRTPDLTSMSTADLAEYSTLVATTIQCVDRMMARTAMSDHENTALLNGAKSEEDMLHEVSNSPISTEDLPSSAQ